MALVSFEMAKRHLRIEANDARFDLDVALKMEQATAHVITYLKRPAHGWTVNSDPITDPDFALTQAAILEVLANLHNDHGDLSTPTPGPITDRVRNLLSMIRDPALA